MIASGWRRFVAGPVTTAPLSIAYREPWHGHRIKPPETESTRQPAWVHRALKPWNSPAVGWVTTAAKVGTTTPPPTGTSAAATRAPAPEGWDDVGVGDGVGEWLGVGCRDGWGVGSSDGEAVVGAGSGEVVEGVGRVGFVAPVRVAVGSVDADAPPPFGGRRPGWCGLAPEGSPGPVGLPACVVAVPSPQADNAAALPAVAITARNRRRSGASFASGWVPSSGGRDSPVMPGRSALTGLALTGRAGVRAHGGRSTCT